MRTAIPQVPLWCLTIVLAAGCLFPAVASAQHDDNREPETAAVAQRAEEAFHGQDASNDDDDDVFIPGPVVRPSQGTATAQAQPGTSPSRGPPARPTGESLPGSGRSRT